MQLHTTLPESKFPNEYSDVIFIQIDQHLQKLLQKYKGSRFYESRCSWWMFMLAYVTDSEEDAVPSRHHLCSKYTLAVHPLVSKADSVCYR